MGKVDLAEYLKAKENRKLLESFRILCTQCLQPGYGCYCQDIQKVDPGIQFIILIHPIEARKRIATGRMTYLHLHRSEIIRAKSYGDCPMVNSIISNKNNNCVVLFPGPGAVDIDDEKSLSTIDIHDSEKNLVVFVIDGTWTTAGKTIRRSENLSALKRICFTPEKSSAFKVRKQPRDYCVSTIEAVHHCIEKMGPSRGFDIETRKHDILLKSFTQLVDRQIVAMKKADAEGRFGNRRNQGIFDQV